ncbi:MAG: hypothetical protein ACFE0Q_06220 [Anaerolineae bacterium]
MQAVNNEQLIDNQTQTQLTIPVEVLAYLILIALALVLRFANLGAVVMTDAEAVQALPAYHAVYTDAPGNPQPANSVLGFWSQRLSFVGFGGTEFASRLPGALGGVVLILMPLLFRQRIGRDVTFLISLMLACSPIAFSTARFVDPTLWTMIGALGFLWALWRYYELPITENALWLALWLALTLLWSGAGGLMILLVLIGAGIVTIAWTVYTAPTERDSPGDEVLRQIGHYLRQLPWIVMFALMVGLTLIVATGFFTDPNGLSIVANALGDAVQGFWTKSTPDAPNFHALSALLIYEPLLLVLSALSIARLLSTGTDHTLDRFAMGWVLVAGILFVLYRGSVPAQALFFVLPMSYLSARLVSVWLVNHLPAFLSQDAYYSNNPDDYAWIKWLVALIVLAGLIMMSLYLATLGRALLNYPADRLTFSTDQQSVLLYARFGWFVIMGLLIVVIYFLLASMWGNRAVSQGYGLGTFAFMLVIGLGTGWNTTVVHVNQSAELWHTTGISPNAYQLRQTLVDVSRRDTRGFHAINLVILRDETAGVTGDSLVAWLVRDFTNARFVDTLAEARQQEVILLPELDEEPDLGGSYVGQRFVIREHSIARQVSAMDWISWYTHRRTRPHDLPQDVTVLWLRIDVYDGIPSDQRP